MKYLRILLNHNIVTQCTNALGKQNIRLYSSIGLMEEKIKVGEYEVNYAKAGSGPHPVICMPGALGSIWTDFKPQIEGLNRNTFTVVAWDPPGYGKSIPPSRKFPVDFYEKDADLAVLLMKELSFPKFSILGWSDGGISGMMMAAKYPSSIDRLVFWGAGAYLNPSEVKLYEDIRDINKWSDKMKEPMIRTYGEEYFKKTWEDWVDGMIELYNKNKGNICMHMIQQITCPTLILHGAKDPMLHKDHAPFLHTNIDSAKLHVYPDGKHNIHLRYAEDFNKRVTDFLLSKI